MRVRVYWASIGSTWKHLDEGTLWHKVLARELVPWKKRVRGHIRKTSEGWLLLPAGWFNTEKRMYLTQEAAVKAVLNNEMWPGHSADDKTILLLAKKHVFIALVFSMKLLAKGVFGEVTQR